MTRKVIVFAALAACLVGAAQADWVCSDTCVDGMGFQKISLCGSGNMPLQGNPGTVCAKNQEHHANFPTTQSSPCRGTDCSRIACPKSYCDATCSAEGVAKGSSIDCYNATIKMASTAQAANDRAVAFGCHGSHAMGKMFMIGATHTACDSPIMYPNAGDTPSGETPPANGKTPPAKGNTPDPAPAPAPAPGKSPVKGRPDTTGMKPEEAAKAKKDAATAKKAEADEKKKAAQTKRTEATQKREDAKAKKSAAEEKKAKAMKTRDSLVANITDVKKKKKATMLADAAIAGKKIKKIKANFTAANETAACDVAFSKMGLNSTAGACDVSNATSSRRRLLADSAYSVEVLLSEAELTNDTIAAALDTLAQNNVTAETSTEDALTVLATVPGIDNATLTTLNSEATAAAAATADATAAEMAAAAAESEATTLETEATTLAEEATTLDTEAAAAENLVSPPPSPPPSKASSPPPPASGASTSSARAFFAVVVAAVAALAVVA